MFLEQNFTYFGIHKVRQAMDYSMEENNINSQMVKPIYSEPCYYYFIPQWIPINDRTGAKLELKSLMFTHQFIYFLDNFFNLIIQENMLMIPSKI